MISFIWPLRAAMLAGTGGSETFTAGHVRELMRRGIKSQIVIVGSVAKLKQSRHDFPDLPFLGLSHEKEISNLPGMVVFVNRAYDVPTRNKAAIILHCVVPPQAQQRMRKRGAAGKIVMATSEYSARQWARYLDISSDTINVVMPFADPAYGVTRRAKPAKKTRVLFAGRLHPDKGIYTLLEMMHLPEMRKLSAHMSIVMAGQHVEEGRAIAKMLKGYKYAKLIDPQKTVAAMAALLAKTDILLMPSVYAEPFGMLSVEAQHSGCRVVASDLGGLPETNCGLLTLVGARNPQAIIAAVAKAMALGLPTNKERKVAKDEFTLSKSVDSLLEYLPHKIIMQQ
jgi:D-inositol-3-phosphate glycosyltransferase